VRHRLAAASRLQRTTFDHTLRAASPLSAAFLEIEAADIETHFRLQYDSVFLPEVPLMKSSFRSYASTIALLVFGLASLGCSEDADSGVSEQQVAADYATLVEASYADSLAEAIALQGAIYDFTESPGDRMLLVARSAWLASRNPYGETEAFRFAQGPIDNDVSDDEIEDGPEGLINAWPIDELYIDYGINEVTGELVNGGIVNSPEEFPTIDEALLVELNTKAGETSISTGYHAIEFLLWGQDRSVEGPGERPASDYFTDGSGTAENQERRATYLRVAADLLVTNLTSVHDAWKEGDDTYRAAFLAKASKEAITDMLQGMGSLSGAELSKERMSVAYDNRAQEDEHSCFSDNTKQDLHNNATSVQNVLLGKYGDFDGAGIDDLVEAKDAALADKLRSEIQDAIDAIDAIPAPFDQAILGEDDSPGREAVIAAVHALEKFTETLQAAAKAIGVELTLE
jgi:putative iron-regulated protein